MKIYHIPVTRSARYYTYGELNTNTRHIYIALHGYGQLASQLIHKFDDFPKDVFIIAPEGLSRFYWDGLSGQVGASWMTKDDRDFEIEEYCNFLDTMFLHFLPQIPANAKVHVLGFSQGGTTAMRWLLLRRPERIDSILLWGSDAAPDLDYPAAKQYLSDKKLFWIYGDKDQYLPEFRVKQLKKQFETFQLSPETIVFEGAHELHRPTLAAIHNNFSNN